MKKVIIDCRYLGMSGIGRFLEGILRFFDYDKFDTYLLGKKEKIEQYQKCKYIYDETSPFSPKAILKNKNKKIVNSCDVFLSPNFIIPYWVKIKSVCVLHDIIFLDMKEVNSGKLETSFKKMLLKRCTKKADTIFTVSNFSKNRIIYHFPKSESKIKVIYPGVGDNFKSYNTINEKEKYVVYVGNIKKNKGLKTLIQAAPLLHDLKICIIGDEKGFKNGDSEVIDLINESKNVYFTGKISDDELIKTISKAKFLIQPSLYEGFGLPPLEGLYINTKPIISDIDVFKEVYSDLPAIFFKLNDYKDLADKINNSDPNFSFDRDYANNKFSSSNSTKEIINNL